MKIILVSIGKKHDNNIAALVQDYTLRLQKYFETSWAILPPAKKAIDQIQIKKEEAQTLLNFIQKDDYVILLDEHGKILSSPETANKIRLVADASYKRLLFVIGGAYGVNSIIKERANFTWSFSLLVFPHMLARCILVEQVYRACTILKNEKYHH